MGMLYFEVIDALRHANALPITSMPHKQEEEEDAAEKFRNTEKSYWEHLSRSLPLVIE
jgi:hypothetical protein